jgi:hypothetical protein
VDDPGSYLGVSSTTTPIVANEWHHIVVIFNVTNPGTGSGNFVLYVNGTATPLDSDTFSDWFGEGSPPLMIGADRNGNFKGQIDDVRIYNRVLSASEVTQLYRSEK